MKVREPGGGGELGRTKSGSTERTTLYKGIHVTESVYAKQGGGF